MPHGYRDGYASDRRREVDRHDRDHDGRYRGHDRSDYGQGYDGDGRDRWAPPARRILRLVRRFVVIAAIVLIPLLILLVIGVVLLVMWIFGNAGPLTGALDGVAQFVNQIAGIVNVFGGG